MSPPRAVVIPFGVPNEGRGLGLGLAALVHTFVQVEGGGVAIAQLHARRNEEPGDSVPAPVEAFVPPAAWKDIATRGDAPAGVGVVLTGAFEPPLEGHGTIQLLVFDARDGRTRARVDVPLDDTCAGASLVRALEQIWTGLGGEIGALGGLRDLDWESLESVLRAERCALHDPLRGGPHDRLAAMLHLGRAIEDAPLARYPVERLAALALETAAGPALDGKLAAAAARALERAVEDAPSHVELVEALAALLLRLGRARDAERRLNAAIALSAKRARLYALLSQALRAQGNLDAALTTLNAGAQEAGSDPLLGSERGLVLAARGDLQGAEVEWRQALASDPVHPAAFGSMAALALRGRDATTAQWLVDAALASPRAHPDVLRRAVQLVLATEGEGIARASRVARLCTRLLEATPSDPWAVLALAKSLVTLGEGAAARTHLAEIERMAPRSAPAAEAQIVKLAIDDSSADLEVQSVLRAAHVARPEDLDDIAARARRVATLHGSWLGWLAAAVAERRRGRLVAARGALDVALESAPGAPPLHSELVEVLLSLDDAQAAVSHAQSVLSLEGESSRGLLVLGRALSAAGRTGDARDAVRKALVLDPENASARELEERWRRSEQQPPSGWGAKLRAMLRGGSKG
jgi:tetratricopeptide (TPR) repeat protein